MFLFDNFRKFPKKSQNVTTYHVTIYTVETLDSRVSIKYFFSVIEKTRTLIYKFLRFKKNNLGS